jgi:2-enoate reductase
MFNFKIDEYGGTLENTLRLAKEVVEEIKKTCGEDFPVTCRIDTKD